VDQLKVESAIYKLCIGSLRLAETSVPSSRTLRKRKAHFETGAGRKEGKGVAESRGGRGNLGGGLAFREKVSDKKT